VDAQSGGPGKGRLRLGTDPWQARRVIEQGKRAVRLDRLVQRLRGSAGIRTGRSVEPPGVAQYDQYPDLLAYMRQQAGGLEASRILFTPPRRIRRRGSGQKSADCAPWADRMRKKSGGL